MQTGHGPKRIGDFLLDRKLITPAQVEQILEYSRKEHLRFGEAGIELGIISEDALVRLFGKNYRVDFFHLEEQFFPRQTSGLLSIETILRYGVLPLGLKTEYGLFKSGKMLNLGMLDPSRKEALEAAKQEAGKQTEIGNIRMYLVLAEQFLNVLDKIYGVGAEEISRRPAESIDRTLLLFLDSKERA